MMNIKRAAPALEDMEGKRDAARKHEETRESAQ